MDQNEPTSFNRRLKGIRRQDYALCRIGTSPDGKVRAEIVFDPKCCKGVIVEAITESEIDTAV